MSYLSWEDLARLLIASDNRLMNIFKKRKAIWRDIFLKNTNLLQPLAIGCHNNFDLSQKIQYDPETIKRYTLPLVNLASSPRIDHGAIERAQDGYELLKQRMSFSGTLVENSPPKILSISCEPLEKLTPLIAYNPVDPIVAVAPNNFNLTIYRLSGADLYQHGPILFSARIPKYELDTHVASLEQPSYCIVSLQWSPRGTYLMVQVAKIRREMLSVSKTTRLMDENCGAKYSKRIVIIKYDSVKQEASIINDESSFRVDSTLAGSNLWVNDHQFILPGHNNTNRLRTASIFNGTIKIFHTSIFDCHVPFRSIKSDIKVLPTKEEDEYPLAHGLRYIGAYTAGKNELNIFLR